MSPRAYCVPGTTQEPSWEKSPDYHRDINKKGLTLSSAYSPPHSLRVGLQKAKDSPRSLAVAPPAGYCNPFPTGTGLQGAETLGANTGAEASPLESGVDNSALLIG